jgi:hypothetical protein
LLRNPICVFDLIGSLFGPITSIKHNIASCDHFVALVINTTVPGIPPESNGMRNRINTLLLPPKLLGSNAVNRLVMGYTKGHRPLIANLAPKSSRLRKSQMMSLPGRSTADDAGLRGDITQMRLIPDAPRRADRKAGLVNVARVGACGSHALPVYSPSPSVSLRTYRRQELCRSVNAVTLTL